jgi:hypothetical protein
MRRRLPEGCISVETVEALTDLITMDEMHVQAAQVLQVQSPQSSPSYNISKLFVYRLNEQQLSGSMSISP